MTIKPVSFGSIQVFTLKDGKPKTDVPTLVRTAFKNNPKLKAYEIKGERKYEEKIDFSTDNATRNLAIELDKRYQSHLLKGAKKLYFTEAEFYVNPRDIEKKYFITASTKKEEEELLNIFNQKGSAFMAVMYA